MQMRTGRHPGHADRGDDLALLHLIARDDARRGDAITAYGARATASAWKATYCCFSWIRSVRISSAASLVAGETVEADGILLVAERRNASRSRRSRTALGFAVSAASVLICASVSFRSA